MPYAVRKPIFCITIFLYLLLAISAHTFAGSDVKRFYLEFEGGPVWQSYNDVSIPGDSGTEFSFKDLNDNWYAGAGYRVLEGGADNDTAYNFAWFNFVFFSIGYRY